MGLLLFLSQADGVCYPNFAPAMFTDVAGVMTGLASTMQEYAVVAWNVNFNNGDVLVIFKDDGGPAWCVR